MKKISLALQSYYIKRMCPNWQSHITKSKLICEGCIKPIELSKQYKVKLIYILGKKPRITLVEPLLELNFEGKRAPHLYTEDLLCVYHPIRNEWNSSKIIADTIIPWISLWLYYYEVWLATGIWKGGGEHPPSPGDGCQEPA